MLSLYTISCTHLSLGSVTYQFLYLITKHSGRGILHNQFLTILHKKYLTLINVKNRIQTFVGYIHLQFILTAILYLATHRSINKPNGNAYLNHESLHSIHYSGSSQDKMPWISHIDVFK